MENKKCCSLKTFFIIVGAVVSIGALIAVIYAVCKKYFKITFECDGDCECCDGCDEDSFEETEYYEPICCCSECAEEVDECVCGEEEAAADTEEDAE